MTDTDQDRTADAQPTIEVSAVVLRDDRGRVLTVRKRGTSRFMFPGGKREPGETFEQAAVREAAEEVGIVLDPEQLVPLGTFTTAAANEDGHQVQAWVFAHPRVQPEQAGAEIEELRWQDPALPYPDDLAPLLAEAVFPALARDTIGWVTVFAGSSAGVDPAYVLAVSELGAHLAAAGLGIVYGGGGTGLMGAAADAALDHGGAVVGVIPLALMARELGHPGLTRLEVVADMHERKRRMAALGDAFVALPGGIGTLEELFEVWTWQQLGFHAKPVALYDVGGFWQPLVALVDHMVTAGFLGASHRELLIVRDTPEGLVAALQAWRPASD
ncbi:MAG TPA: TIGR00730 family Rossman fold protein [Propionicimonas sp.]